MNNQKVGLTTLNWVLSIGGIVLLSLFIILPPVLRTYFPKPQEEVKEPEPLSPVYIMTCEKENISEVNYTDKVTYNFEYQKELLKKYEKITNRVYNDPLFYIEEKTYYGKLVPALNIITSYKYSTEFNDDIFKVDIKENYDLSTFETSMIVVPGDDEPTTIESIFSFNTNILEVEKALTSDHFTCSTNE